MPGLGNSNKALFWRGAESRHFYGEESKMVVRDDEDDVDDEGRPGTGRSRFTYLC